MKRHYLLSLAVASALFLPSTASAYTARELSNVAWIATYTSNPNFNGTSLIKAPLIDSHGVTAEYIDATHIRLNGIQGCLDFILTITNANGVETPDGEYLLIKSDEYAVNVSASEYASQSWQMLQAVRSGYSSGIYTYKRTSDNLLFRISKNDDNTYTMLSTTPVFVHGSADSGVSGYLIRIFDQMELTSFEPNAIMSDRFYETYGFSNNSSSITNIYPTSPERIREYPVRVEFDYTNNRFTILNFGNNGYGLRENLRYYVNLNNTSLQSFTDGKFIIGGSFDPETKKLTFDKNQFAKPVWAPYGPYYWVQEDMFNFQLERLDLEGNTTVDELFGTYEGSKGEVHHNNAPDGWVSHGGKRRTLEDVSIEIETYTYYLNQLLYNRLNFEGGYYDTHIDCGDVTLQTEYEKGQYDVGSRTATSGSDPLAHVTSTQFTGGNNPGSEYHDGTDEWGIVPVIHTLANEQYVQSYEVMAVPGRYTTAAQVQDHIDEAIKFRRIFINDGTKLTEGTGNPVFNADDAKKGWYKPGDFRIARKGNGATGEDYTFFIKANYKPETQLSSTFHDVYPYTFFSSLPTSADAIDYGSIEVKGTNGGIEIAGANMQAEIFDIAGLKVYSGTDSRIELPTGIYMVKIGRNVYKVQVR